MQSISRDIVPFSNPDVIRLKSCEICCNEKIFPLILVLFMYSVWEIMSHRSDATKSNLE